jgi:hypothetical protein
MAEMMTWDALGAVSIDCNCSGKKPALSRALGKC